MDFELNETIGIDFGTSFSTVSKFENGEVKFVLDEYHNPYIPTYLSYHNNKFLCGMKALEKACSNPGNTIYEIKRLIGRSYKDEVITRCVKQMPYSIVDDQNGGVLIEINDGNTMKQYKIESLIKIFVDYLKELAKDSLGQYPKNCIITVPSFFSVNQKNIIFNAVKEASLNVINVLTEPTAAALAYYSSDNKGRKIMAVYDFGGGTFDVSVLQLVYSTYEVLATSSDIEVGGKDITAVVSEYIMEKLKENSMYAEYCKSKQGLELIRKHAEKMKEDLTFNDSANTFIELDGDGMEIILQRTEFEKRIHPIVQRTIDVVMNTVHDVEMEPKDIESIILIGGSSFIPLVRCMLKESFPTSQILTKIDTRSAVATGALRYASIIKEGKNFSESISLKNPGDMFAASSLLKNQVSKKTVEVDGKTVTFQPPMLPDDYKEFCTPFDNAIGLVEETMKKCPRMHNSDSIYDVLKKAGLSVDSTFNINSITVNDIVNHAFTQSSIDDVDSNEYSLSNEPVVFTDVTPLSIGYVDSNHKYHELIKRNEKLPTSRSFKFSCKYTKNMVLSLTIADSHDPASGQYSIIGSAQLNNVPPPADPKLSVTVHISIDANNSMKVTISESQSKMKRSYYYNGRSDSSERVQEAQDDNRSTHEKTYRAWFNNMLIKSMQMMDNFVKKTGNADCRVNLMEMKEVMKRQNEFTVEQLKEIMEKINTIFHHYNIC